MTIRETLLQLPDGLRDRLIAVPDGLTIMDFTIDEQEILEEKFGTQWHEVLGFDA